MTWQRTPKEQFNDLVRLWGGVALCVVGSHLMVVWLPFVLMSLVGVALIAYQAFRGFKALNSDLTGAEDQAQAAYQERLQEVKEDKDLWRQAIYGGDDAEASGPAEVPEEPEPEETSRAVGPPDPD